MTTTEPTGVDMRSARWLRMWSLAVLVPVAIIGAVLSFESLRKAAEPVFHSLAYGFPLLVDFLILGCSLQYVAGAKTGKPRPGWRWTAHAGVAGTLTLNAMAAHGAGEIPWHVTAPAVWSVLVELTAREVLGQWRAAHTAVADRIPLRLWLTAPGESVRASWRMARTGLTDATVARAETERCAAAQDLLRSVMRPSRARRQVLRRLWSGAITPDTLARIVATTEPGKDRPARIHAEALQAITGVTHTTQESRGVDAAPKPTSRPAIEPAPIVEAPAIPAVEPAPERPQSPVRQPSRPRTAPRKPGGGGDQRVAIRGYKAQNPTATQDAIARHFGCSVRTVRRALEADVINIAERTGS